MKVQIRYHDGLKQYLLETKNGDINKIRGLTHLMNKSRDISTDYKAVIKEDKCNNCGACMKVCYSDAILSGPEWHSVNRTICIGRGLCSGVCSENAIYFK